jgi:nitroimidazol reductase NimA-like FMN-containing flavoprotein (pyridoxamine 5'-phosphate oxidase superfamily)
MDLGYLDYLETTPDPDPSQATVLRLAAVLDTTPSSLRGAHLQNPPGGGRSSPTARLLELTPEDCLVLIAPGGVGRFIYHEPRGPAAVPVNFGVLDGDVVFRTAVATAVAACATQSRVSFQVDHIDDALREGWSVLISGQAHSVSDPDELAQVKALPLWPWAPGQRDSYFRLVAEKITGRRLRATNGQAEPTGTRPVIPVGQPRR